jgi:hypothetical protein
MSHAESRRLAELACKQAGINLFEALTDNERTGVRVGMLPGPKTKAAEAALYEANPDILETLHPTEVARALALGVFAACNASGKGMVV